jgi:hypothetical protein
MLLLKIRNAGELLWESLDRQERLVAFYALGWAALMVALALHRSSRERLKRELVDELTGGARGSRD